MTDRYILVDRKPVEEPDLYKWADWRETEIRHVSETKINDVRVSTVFLGIDHRFGDVGPPLLFETMVFGGVHDGYQERYATWEDAEQGHATALALVRKEAIG